MGPNHPSASSSSHSPLVSRLASSPPDPIEYPKIEFLWLRTHSSLYQMLSANILREIITYFTQFFPPVAVESDKITTFDVLTLTWRPSRGLERRLDIDSKASVVFFEYNTVLVCGGKFSILYLEKKAYIVTVMGMVTDQPDMASSRYGPGLIYHAGVFYVFGGHDGIEALQTCESLRLSTHRWESLSPMQRKRFLFNPCLYDTLIYLCGGHNGSMEVFNLQTLGFSIKWDFIFPVQTFTAAVVYNEELISIGADTIYRGSVTGLITERQTHLWMMARSQCVPVVKNGRVYLVDATINKACRVMELGTGLEIGRFTC